jgi:acyl carrier protein
MSFGDKAKMILERGSFMEKEEVRASLTELIAEEMPELDEIDMEKNIISEYGINSVSIIRLIVAAEEKYEITFSDFELSLDEYDTFGDLAMVIKEKLDEKDD